MLDVTKTILRKRIPRTVVRWSMTPRTPRFARQDMDTDMNSPAVAKPMNPCVLSLISFRDLIGKSRMIWFGYLPTKSVGASKATTPNTGTKLHFLKMLTRMMTSWSHAKRRNVRKSNATRVENNRVIAKEHNK